MLSCKDYVKIVSSEKSSSLKQKLALYFHYLICHHCRKYTKQLEILKLGFKKLFLIKSENIEPKKIEELEKRIIETTKKSV